MFHVHPHSSCFCVSFLFFFNTLLMPQWIKIQSLFLEIIHRTSSVYSRALQWAPYISVAAHKQMLLYHKSPKKHWGPLSSNKHKCFLISLISNLTLTNRMQRQKQGMGLFQSASQIHLCCTLWCSTTPHQQRATQHTLWATFPFSTAFVPASELCTKWETF